MFQLILPLLLFERKKKVCIKICTPPVFYRKSSILWMDEKELLGSLRIIFETCQLFSPYERFSVTFLAVFTTSALKEHIYLKKKDPHGHHLAIFSKIAYPAILLPGIFPKSCTNKITKWHMPLYCSLKVGIMSCLLIRDFVYWRTKQ